MQRLCLTQRLQTKALWLFRDCNYEPTEFWLAMDLFAWIVVLLFVDNFLKISPTLDFMNHLRPQSQWAMVASAVFLTHSLGVFVNVRALRIAGVFLTSVWFLFVASMFIWVAIRPVNPSMGVGLFLALRSFFSGGWAFLRLAAHEG